MRHLPMFALLLNMLATLRSAFRTRAELALENLALRQQLLTGDDLREGRHGDLGERGALSIHVSDSPNLAGVERSR
jgi:hypothetical protein